MTTKKQLNRFVGRLSAAEIVEGMNAARRNARRLLEDAELFLKAERYPSALAFAILSIEESGKTTILRDLSTATTEEDVKQIWRDFRSHAKKNRLWILPDLVGEGIAPEMLLRNLLTSEAEHPAALDAVKQVAIYVDCFGRRHWSKPWEVVSKELAASVITTARLFAPDRETTTEQIELWIEYIGPARKEGSGAAILRAFLAWEQEAIRRGWETDSPEARFLREGYLNLLSHSGSDNVV